MVITGTYFSIKLTFDGFTDLFVGVYDNGKTMIKDIATSVQETGEKVIQTMNSNNITATAQQTVENFAEKIGIDKFIATVRETGQATIETLEKIDFNVIISNARESVSDIMSKIQLAYNNAKDFAKDLLDFF